MAVQQLVIFNVNNESFGVEITQVKEIIRPMDIYKIPNTPDYIEGLINLRGKVHTVFNLRKKFNLPDKSFELLSSIFLLRFFHYKYITANRLVPLRPVVPENQLSLPTLFPQLDLNSSPW